MDVARRVGSAYGYDTVVLAVRQPRAFDGVRWESVRQTSGPTVLHERRWRNEPLFQLTYVRQVTRSTGEVALDELRLQCSLPKVLHGSNVETVTTDEEVRDALRAVSALAVSSSGVEVDWWSGAVRRVDVTANEQLPDEAMVAAVLARLAQVALRGRYPVRGESALSVSWPRRRGSFTRKAYSKFEESGDERARGLLRLEVGCNGEAAVRKGSAAARVDGGRPTGPSSPGCQVGQVVTAAALVGETGARLRSKVGGAMTAFVGPYVREVSEVESYQAFLKFRAGHRSGAAAAFVGWALLVQQLGGWPALETFITRQGVWKLRRAFAAAGVDPFEVDFSARGGEVYARMLAESKREEERRAGQMALAGLDELAEVGDGVS